MVRSLKKMLKHIPCFHTKHISWLFVSHCRSWNDFLLFLQPILYHLFALEASFVTFITWKFHSNATTLVILAPFLEIKKSTQIKSTKNVLPFFAKKIFKELWAHKWENLLFFVVLFWIWLFFAVTKTAPKISLWLYFFFLEKAKLDRKTRNCRYMC